MRRALLRLALSMLLMATLPVCALAQCDPAPKMGPTPGPQVAGIRYPLDGLWLTSDGDEVCIQDFGSSVVVQLKTNQKCPYGGELSKLLELKREDNYLKGTTYRCTRGKHLIPECGLTPTYESAYEGMVVSADSIEGNWKTEWYDENPKGNPCKYTRNPSGDHDEPLNLARVRIDSPPPDPRSSSGVCGPDTKPKTPDDNKALDQVVKGLKDAIKKLQAAAEQVGGSGSEAAQAAREIKGKIDKIKQYMAFWQRVQAASCLPQDVSQLLQQYASYAQNGVDTSGTCTELCAKTADWIVKLTGNDTDRITFMQTCVSNCGR